MRKIPNINPHIFKQPNIPFKLGITATGVAVSESAGVYTLSYTVSETETNKPPVIDKVTVTSDGDPGFQEGDTLTAAVSGFQAFDGGSEGTHTYQWYRADDNQDTSLAAIAGATASTYVLTSDDISTNIYCEVTPVQTGSGANLTGAAVKSFYTQNISAALPAIYNTISPLHLYQKGDYVATGGGVWTDTGSVGENLAGLSGGVPTLAAGGEADFDGTQGLEVTLASGYPDSGWTSWIKFNLDEAGAAFKNLYDWSNACEGQVNKSNGNLISRSTTGGNSAGAMVGNWSVNLNLIVTHDNSGNIIQRMEKDDGTVIIDDVTVTTSYNNAEPAAGKATLGMDVVDLNKMTGSIHEFGAVSGVISAGNKTSLMTYLKAL